ncbi:MAG: leucyl aminopeptidase [Verrucomicrobiota bacterium]
MPFQVQVTSNPAPKGSDLVRFCHSGERLPAGVPEAEFSGGLFTSALVRDDGSRILYVGLGEKKELKPKTFVRAAGFAVRQSIKRGATTLRFDLGRHGAMVRAAVEGAKLGAYKFEDFKRPEERRPHELKRLVLQVSAAGLSKARAAAKQGAAVGNALNTARAVGNLPPNVLNPGSLAARASALAKKHGLACKVFDHKRLAKDGFGGLLAVGGGSAHPPRLITLEYRGGPKGQAPVALVGKAITFDSGGLSIKPSASMDEMKWDKMGGITVLGIMQAVAALRLPFNVVAVIASAENMLGTGAYRPSDIVTTYDGKTIEVLNTDAEGRIVLADGLAYARQTYRPVAMVEFSTLTGACLVALGRNRAGLFSESADLIKTLERSSEATGDQLWNLPMGGEFDEAVKSEVATVKNAGERWGGASFAASFLQTWAENTPFAHLDIAGTAWITKERPDLEAGATGFGVRLILDALPALAKRKG